MIALYVILGVLVVFALVMIIRKQIIKKESKKIVDGVDSTVALELKNVTKIYRTGDNDVLALNDVSLSFRKNEFVSVLGPSGCGKTTMLNLVGGLDRYTQGDIVINGTSTKEYKGSDWDTYRNNSIGFVFQTYNLIMHQSVINNVEMALTLSGISREERKERALKVLKQVGLEGQEYKKPNQLSGGQMQRVAIARALVNNPDIILADEPTGALDTKTSIQIMELLREVASDRLVIMVTHNPELADKYSTRIINLLDGKVTGDTNPLKKGEAVIKKVKKQKGLQSSMGLFTAFNLSLSNLRTKKGRTTLTSIAGSIGIIGIAMVLALSTGFSSYINNLQANTLSSYPLTINESNVNLDDFEDLLSQSGLEAFPVLKEIYTREMFGSLANMLKSNKLTKEYLDYIDDFVSEKNSKSEDGWQYGVSKEYGFDVNNYIYSNIGFSTAGDDGKPGNTAYSVMPVDMMVRMLEEMFAEGISNSQLPISSQFVRQYIPTMGQLPDNLDVIKSQYALIHGEWATEADEVMLVVNKYNQVDDITLGFLGYRSIEGISADGTGVKFGGDATLSFEDVCDNKNFYYIGNDARYAKMSADNCYYEHSYNENALPDTAMKIKVKGIIRPDENADSGILDTGIAYTSKFVEMVLEDNADSQIVLDTANGNEKISVYSVLAPITLEAYEFAVSKGFMDGVSPIQNTIRELGGSDKVSKISIYCADYQTKEDIKAYLNEWNEVEGRLEEDEVHYSDMSADLFSAMNLMVDAVKIVLIAFTSISLVVSSIMIGIITYVSVVERTKEIGVLRSLGARKKDISRIFNAETFIIGLLAGIIGIGFTYLVSIPVNVIIGGLVKGATSLFSLNVVDAIVLVVISFILTLISGVIPSRIAANKDPVVALRTE